MWKPTFGAQLPSKSESWRCENEPLVRDFPQSLKAEDVKTDLSCETYLRVCKLKMWKRSFRARRTSKSECWRFENGASVRDVPQSLKAEDVNKKLSCETSLNLNVEDVKTNLSFETSLKFCKLKMWKRSFRVRRPSESSSWRCENGAFVRDLPESLKAEDVKAKLSCETSLEIWTFKMWKRSFRAQLPSESASWRCKNKAFVRNFPSSLKAEDVKAKLSCETIPQNLNVEVEDVKTELWCATSLRVCNLKAWKRSFRAWRPSKYHCWRCENEVFMRDFLQSLQAEDVKTNLSFDTSLRVCKLKMWKRTFRARLPSKSESWRCENEAFMRDIPQSLKAEDVKMELSCETSLKVWKLKMWKPSFRARGLSKSERWRCENEAFVQDFLQSLKAEDVKAKLSCEMSLKIRTLKMWKRSFRARLPSESASWKRESEAFMRDVPQNLNVEDVKIKLLCKTSLKVCKLKMWKRTFRARRPSKSEHWRCANEAFVRDLPQNLHVEDVKAKLSCENPSKSESWRCESEAFVREVPPNLNVEDVKTNLSCKTSFRFCKLKMWKRTFRARLPSESASWRCESKAFVRDLPQNLNVEERKTKLSCEPSLRVCKLKPWMRSFRARRPSKSKCWRCENKAFVQDFPQSLQAEDVKTNLSCETSLKIWTLKMCKRSFRARRPSKSERWRCESEAFVRDFPQSLKAGDVNAKLSCETSLKIWTLQMWKRSFRARRPSKSECWRKENEAFLRDVPQNLNVEDVTTKLSCETFLRVGKLKMWKRSFRARLPWKSERWRCENEAFVRDFPQSLKAEDVKTNLSCETSLKIWTLKMWKRSFRARRPSKSESWRCESEAFVRDIPQNLKIWNRSFRAGLPSESASWRCESEAFVWDVPQSLRAEDVKTELSCEICLKVWKLKMWKRSFRARCPSKSERWRCENEAFVQNFLQSLQAEEVKAKLSCETSLKIWTLKMWKRSFRARHPSKSESWRCENKVFVRDFPQSRKAEDVKTKLSCEPSLKIWMLKTCKRSFGARHPSKSASWRCECEAFVRDLPFTVCKFKMWMRSFRARIPSKSERWRCENEAFVRDFPQSLQAEDVKAKLSWETSLKIWTLKMWKWNFRARIPSKSERWRCENKAFVQNFLQSLQAEDVKAKLSCETSLKIWMLKTCRCENEAFVLDVPQNLNVEDMKMKLSCETSSESESWSLRQSLQVEDRKTKWHPFALTYLCCGVKICYTEVWLSDFLRWCDMKIRWWWRWWRWWWWWWWWWWCCCWWFATLKQ